MLNIARILLFIFDMRTPMCEVLGNVSNQNESILEMHKNKPNGSLNVQHGTK